MKTEILKEKYVKYNLTKDDVFKHQHYIILTRSHLTAIVDGEHLDAWNCGTYRANSYYQILNKSE